MKIKNVKAIVLVALILIASVTFGVIYTNAKYTSTVPGQVSTSVAKYVFNVSGSDSYKTTDTLTGLKLAQTCTPATLVDGKIAPGTSGSFDIVVNTNGADVGVQYDISFVNTTTHSLPTNLKFKLDGNDWVYTNGIHGTIDADDVGQVVTHTVTWEWDYGTGVASADAADTADGQNAFDYAFTITAIGTQVRPVAQ